MGDVEAGIEAQLRARLPLYEHMGLRVESASNGVFRCAVPLREGNLNHFRTVHAALQWAAAEALGGLVWFSTHPDESRFVPVIRRYTIEFKKPAWTEVVAETRFSDAEAAAMDAALERDGRYDFELESVIRNADGEIVAEGKGAYAIRSAIKLSR